MKKIIFTIVIYAFCFTGFCQNGQLDSTFGTYGKVNSTSLNDARRYGSSYSLNGYYGISGMALQSDGKIVVAGATRYSDVSSLYPTITRYNTNGSRDMSFSSGSYLFDFTYLDNNIFDEKNACFRTVKIQPDGKIIGAGYAYTGSGFDFVLGRLNPNGRIDSTFSFDGRVDKHIGSVNVINALAIQQDGKIIAAGYADDDIAVLRYNPDGTLDNTFNNGSVTINVLGVDKANAVAVQSDGKILIAGYSNSVDFTLIRLNSNGTFDNTFGINGITITDFGGTDICRAMALQSDGKIVLAGYSNAASTNDFALARYNTDGSADNSFGNYGKVLTDFNNGGDGANSVIIEPDGKLITSGYMHTSGGSDAYFTVVKYNTNGTLDNTFGTGGKYYNYWGGRDDVANSVVLQPDGKILVGGYSEYTYQYVDNGTTAWDDATNFAMARLYNIPGSSNITASASAADTTICAGTPTQLHVTASGGINYTYSWSSNPGTFSSSDQNPFVSPASTTVYTCTVTSNGSTAFAHVTVHVTTVNTIVTQVGNTLTSSAVTAGYSWVNCNGYIPVSGQTSQSYTPTVTGNYAVIVTQNTCSDTSSCFLVDLSGHVPSTPVAIIGNASACYGSTNIYGVAPVSGATSYTWSLPGGWSGTSTSETIIATAGLSGTISVTANNFYGSSSPQTLNVTVTTVNTIVTQAGYTLTANANGAGYVWINCNGNIPVPGQTSQSFTVTATGSYAVIVTQNACTDTSNCILVDLSGHVPPTPGPIIGNASVCHGSTNIYGVTPVSGATSYTWTLPNGWSGNSTTETIIATAGLSGTISVTANNSYGPSSQRTLNVTVTAVNTSVTQAGYTLTANANGAGYVWINCNGNIPVSGQTSQSFTVTATGNYAVIVTQNACSDTSNCVLVDVSGHIPPTPGSIVGNTLVCHGSTNIYGVAPVSGATTYTWTLPGGWSGLSTSETIIATAGLSGTISVTANNSYGSSSPQTLYVAVTSVNTSVTQSGMALSANASGAGYIWINCNGNTPVSGQTNQTFTAVTPGSYAVIITLNGCTDTSACFIADTTCNIAITGADMPYSGLSVLLAVDSLTNISLGNPGISQSWDYSSLSPNYYKFADYESTSATAYASVFPFSNIYTYGPGGMYGSLYGGAPVGQGDNGYIFWKSDNTGFWITGFRPDGGICAGINVQNTPQELLIGAPATYGSIFNNSGRWELPMNINPADPDTFFVRNINKDIIADACGSLTTPYGLYPNVLREHEHVTEIDSVYIKMSGILVMSLEYRRNVSNNYMYISNGLGYPACIVHSDNNNLVKDVEYYSGAIVGINDKPEDANTFLLYPNPSGGVITIETPVEKNITDNRIYIYNSIGSLIWKKSTAENLISIDLNSQPKGIYILKINNKKAIQTQKFVLQ